MSNQDWLSLTEIARLWSDETGESAEALERDLEAWFSEFVARDPSPQPGTPGRDGGTTNLLMGLLGGRLLQRETFAVYCEERGHAKPRFWFAGGAEDREPHPPLPSDSPTGATSQALTGDARETGPAQRQFEEAWEEQEGYQFEPAQPAPETAHEAPCPTAQRPVPNEPPATPEPAGIIEAQPGPNLVWQAARETLRHATAQFLTWVRALPPAVGGLPGRKATWLAGGLSLGLSLLAAGFVLGQGGIGHSETGPDVAERDQVQKALVSSLRSELATARQKIASLTEEAAASRSEPVKRSLIQAATSASAQALSLKAALETAGPNAETARQELVLAAQAASAHAAFLGRDLDAAQQRIADLGVEADTAKAEAASLAEQLAESRKEHAAVLEKFRVEAEGRATNAGMQSTSAPSGTANVTNAPISPRDAESHAAAARPEPNAVAESIDVDSLVTNPSRYDARQVVVTGSLLRLLQHYRLQSKSGRKTLVVDVAGINRAQHDMLQEAIAGAGLIGSVRVQIGGKVERGSAKAFSLVASDLILVE